MPTGMTIMWETSDELPSKVEYGPTEKLGSAAEISKPTALHEVPIRGLQPGSRYYYRVRSGEVVSEIYSFKTAPVPGTKRWRMAVYGDSRSNPRVHRQIAEQIARAKVDLIVHTGDIVINGKIHAAWRLEFFDPLGALARSVPWVSTIGNHERDSEHYFSYMALPGNERYFAFDYGNAQIVCLDSNAWVAKGRDSTQYKWMEEQLKKKRAATWTFVVFHHPLFSAHATRPIHKLRWDWAPLFLDPACRVDGVLTGHDHFYARNYRMGRLAEKAQPGVLFLTTAGGGAGLYKCKQRDYVAATRSVHHFTLFDFDGDRVKLSAITSKGEVFDSYELTKKPTVTEEFCCYDMEEFKRFLRFALSKQPSLRCVDDDQTTIETTLTVPTRFQVPVSGSMTWEDKPGWKIKKKVTDFHLEPGEPLTIPLQASVKPLAWGNGPALTITFAPGKFRNRTITTHPFKVGGPSRIEPASVEQGHIQDPKKRDAAWERAKKLPLLHVTVDQARDNRPSDQVQFLFDKECLYVRATLSDPDRNVDVSDHDPEAEGSRLVLGGEHLRVVIADGSHVRTFALSPENLAYATCVREDELESKTREIQESGKQIGWRGVATRTKDAWSIQMAIPKKLISNIDKARINVIHQRRVVGLRPSRRFLEFELCPTYIMGEDPDRIPDWRSGDRATQFADLRCK
jgi:hypothetical protein